MRGLRETAVRNLSQAQCKQLLVHAHECSNERRKAYQYKAAGDDWRLYFSEPDGETIREWIRREPMGEMTQEQLWQCLHHTCRGTE